MGPSPSVQRLTAALTDQELCALAPREWADPPAAVWGGYQWSILSHTATCSQPVWMETGAYLHEHPHTHWLGASEAQSQAFWDSSNPSLGLSLLLPGSSLQDGQLLPARLCVSGGPSPLSLTHRIFSLSLVSHHTTATLRPWLTASMQKEPPVFQTQGQIWSTQQ